MGLREFFVKKENRKPLIIGSSVIAVILVAGIGIGAFALADRSEGSRTKDILRTVDREIDKMDYEEAVAHYRDAIELDPTNIEAYVGLAEVYALNGEKEEAEAVLADAMENVSEEDIVVVEEVREEVEEILAEVQETTAAETTAPTETTAAETTEEMETTAAEETETTAAEETETTAAEETETTAAEETETTAAEETETTAADETTETEETTAPEETADSRDLLENYLRNTLFMQTGFSVLGRIYDQVPYNIDGGEAEPVDLSKLSLSVEGIVTYWFADTDADGQEEMVLLMFGKTEEYSINEEDIAVLRAVIVDEDEDGEIGIISGCTLEALSRMDTRINIYGIIGENSVGLVMTGSENKAFEIGDGFTDVTNEFDFTPFTEYEAEGNELTDGAFEAVSISFTWSDSTNAEGLPAIEYIYNATEYTDTGSLGYAALRYNLPVPTYMMLDDGTVAITISNPAYAELASGLDSAFNSLGITASDIDIRRADREIMSFVVDGRYGYNFDSRTGELLAADDVLVDGIEAVLDYAEGCQSDPDQISWVLEHEGITIYYTDSLDNICQAWIPYTESIFVNANRLVSDNDYAVRLNTTCCADVNSDGTYEQISVLANQSENALVITVDGQSHIFDLDSEFSILDASLVRRCGNSYLYVITSGENQAVTRLSIFAFEVTDAESDDETEDEGSAVIPVLLGTTDHMGSSLSMCTRDDRNTLMGIPFLYPCIFIESVETDFPEGAVASYTTFIGSDGLPVPYDENMQATLVGTYSVTALRSSEDAAYDRMTNEPVEITEGEEYRISGVCLRDGSVSAICISAGGRTAVIPAGEEGYGSLLEITESVADTLC